MVVVVVVSSQGALLVFFASSRCSNNLLITPSRLAAKTSHTKRFRFISRSYLTCLYAALTILSMEANDLLVELELILGWSASSSSGCNNCFAFSVGDDGLKDGAMRHAFVGVSGPSSGSLMSSSEKLPIFTHSGFQEGVGTAVGLGASHAASVFPMSMLSSVLERLRFYVCHRPTSLPKFHMMVVL